MKKLLILAALITTVYVSNAQDQQQGGGDPAAMMARMKERVKPQLMEKTKLTDAQADKVIEINFDSRRQMRELRNDQSMSEDDRAKKMADMQKGIEKKYKDIPLTDEQIKSVTAYFDEMRKNMQQQRTGNQ